MTSSIPLPDHFLNAAENGLDFLLRAATQLDSDPKMSIVVFASGVEILLKARLLREHWTLVVDQLDKVDIPKFQAGDFRSITPEQAIQRLRTVCGIAISKDDEGALLAPSRHRNRLLHFYHPDFAEGADPSHLERIAIEQCRAWAHLEQLFNTRAWQAHISQLDSLVARVQAAFRANGEIFLKGKFEAVSDRLKEAQSGGAVLVECQSCHFAAQVLGPPVTAIARGVCYVCQHQQHYFIGACIGCRHIIPCSTSEDVPCPGCGKTNTAMEMILGTPEHRHLNAYLAELVACGACDLMGTVLRQDDTVLYLDCFTPHDTVEQCAYCGQEWATGGDSYPLYSTGCRVCAPGGDEYESIYWSS